ncbi:FAD-dependent oxidoreductase [Sneathiella chungangensis]|uniref:FAD-dependent oxidoreductase n=1 Tax=Sneathiella chungangensis TaxID=1418234 RepID=A0A845M787_9PROT|nr:FAD-dependent oxidoreductase [Sneathiella chungangensis]
MSETADIVIVGAGIAGASLAWRLAPKCKVLLLEAEETPAFHSTGRSAALLTPYAGAPAIKACSLASRNFLRNPPEGFTTYPLVSARGTLLMADATHEEELIASAKEMQNVGRPVRMAPLSEAKKLGIPISERVVSLLIDDETDDIDVNSLHMGFLTGAKKEGAQLYLQTPVTKLSQRSGIWTVTAGGRQFESPIVVNAAGAFASNVATLAGAMRLPLSPKKRTIVMIPATVREKSERWPLIADLKYSFYLKPEATGLLVSPVDAEPCKPHDVQPDEMDIAIAIDKMQQWLDIPVRRIERSWAGLRSFFPDEDPVVGYDAQAEGFFWYAGQGGFGVQSSPALSKVGAALLLKEPLPEFCGFAGLHQNNFSPNRIMEFAR